MQAYLTLTRRELAGFFLSLTGYVVIAGVTFLVGYSFWSLLVNLQGTVWVAPVTEMFFTTLYFWVILLLTIPVITMRLFAQEKFTGTFETLMTTPVGDFQVVAAKFTAALIFYMIMWLPLLACVLILRHYVIDPSGFDPGLIASTFLGMFLLGCVFVSLGCFASALTRSQMTAAMVSVVFCMSLFFLSFVTDRFPGPALREQVLAVFALRDQMHDFSRGVVDTRAVVLYVTLTFFFLYLTLRIIESRRWK